MALRGKKQSVQSGVPKVEHVTREAVGCTSRTGEATQPSQEEPKSVFPRRTHWTSNQVPGGGEDSLLRVPSPQALRYPTAVELEQAGCSRLGERKRAEARRLWAATS